MNQHIPEGNLPLVEVVESLHASYRQVDHWIRKGWVAPEGRDCGSGNHRSIDPHDLVALIAMDQLVALGLPPSKASVLAREFEANPLGEHTEGAVTVTFNWAAIAA